MCPLHVPTPLPLPLPTGKAVGMQKSLLSLPIILALFLSPAPTCAWPGCEPSRQMRMPVSQNENSGMLVHVFLSPHLRRQLPPLPLAQEALPAVITIPPEQPIHHTRGPCFARQMPAPAAAAQRFVGPAPGQRVQQLVEGYQDSFSPRHDASTAATSSAVAAASTAAFFVPPSSMQVALCAKAPATYRARNCAGVSVRRTSSPLSLR